MMPRCSDCGRSSPVMVVTNGGFRFCRLCIDWTIGERMAAARSASKGSSYQATARNAEDADRKIGERFK